MRPRRHMLITATRVATIAALFASCKRGENSTKSGATASAGGSVATQRMPGMAGINTSATGAAKLTAAQLRQFGVTFATVEVRALSAETRAAGVVRLDETKVSQIAPKVGGFVERLYVDATGQAVRRGQPLLDLYSPDLVAAQQDLLASGQLQRDIGRSVVPGVPGATDMVESAKRRLRLWDISDAQIDEVLLTGQVQRTMTLYAPSGGIVMDKRVVRGQSIAAGEPLYTIADLSEVWVDVQLRESDVGNVRAGSSADLELAGLPGRLIKGRVTYVYPTLDSTARTTRARVVVGNTAGLLKPGMYATVRLKTPSRSALAVPNTAVLRTGDRNLVFVDMGGGELMPHDVELGSIAGDYVEVLSGLEPAQRVVTSAQFLLDSESNLGEVMKAMIGQLPSGGAGNKGAASDMKDMPGMPMPAKP